MDGWPDVPHGATSFRRTGAVGFFLGSLGEGRECKWYRSLGLLGVAAAVLILGFVGVFSVGKRRRSLRDGRLSNDDNAHTHKTWTDLDNHRHLEELWTAQGTDERSVLILDAVSNVVE